MNVKKYLPYIFTIIYVVLNAQVSSHSNLSTIENIQHEALTPSQYTSAHTWYPLLPNATESSPTSVEIISSNETETVLEVTIPGFFFEELISGSNSYTKISFNSPILSGLGFGDDDQAAWWEFYGERIPPQRFQKALDIGVSEVPIPPSMRNSKGEISDAPLPGTKPGIPRLRGLFSSHPQWGNQGPVFRNTVSLHLAMQFFEFALPSCTCSLWFF